MNNKKQFNLNWLSRYRDELFGVSILLIILFHYSEEVFTAVKGGAVDLAGSPLNYVWMAYYGAVSSIGVEIFIFLSGMGLYYSFVRNSNVREFLAKRLKRIMLPFLMAGGVFWYIMDVRLLHLDVSDAVKDLFFRSLVRDGARNNWFVLFILVMYLCFPLIYKALYKSRHRHVMFVVLLAASIAGPLLVMQISPVIYSNLEIGLSRIAVFVVGCYCGELIRNETKLPLRKVVILILVGTACGFTRAYFDFPPYIYRYLNLVYALAVMAVITAIIHVMRECGRVNGVLRFFGKYSFELYITHTAMRNLCNPYGIYMYDPANYFVMITAAIALSVLLGRASSLLLRR